MTTPSDEIDLPTTISRNAGVTILANLIYLVSRLFLPPFILNHLTLNEYGIWTYCFIIVGYLGMGVYGIGNVYVRYIAVYTAQKETEKINRLVSTGVLFAAGLCLLCIPVLWFGLPYLIQALKVSENLQTTAFWVIFGTTLIFLLDMVLSVFSYTLQSLHKFTIERTFWTLAILAEVIVIFLTLWWGWGLYGLLAAFAFRIIFFILLCFGACKKLIPNFSISPIHADKQDLHLFYNYGGVVQTTGIISVINRSIERLVAGLSMGPATAALYDIGEKFPMMATSVPSAINTVILPTTSHLHAKEQHDQLVQVYLQSSRWINIITGLMMGFLAPFATVLIAVWLGPKPEYAWAPFILACFTIAYQMDVLTGPGSAIYRGINRPWRELFYALLQLGLVLAAIAILFTLYGASVWTLNLAVVSMMVLSALIYIFRNNNFLNVPQWRFAKKVLLPGIFPYFLGGVLAYFSLPWQYSLFNERWTLFYTLLGALAVYLVVALPLYYYLILAQEERSFLSKFFLFKR